MPAWLGALIIVVGCCGAGLAIGELLFRHDFPKKEKDKK